MRIANVDSLPDFMAMLFLNCQRRSPPIVPAWRIPWVGLKSTGPAGSAGGRLRRGDGGPGAGPGAGGGRPLERRHVLEGEGTDGLKRVRVTRSAEWSDTDDE
jgi:hypothetical protein